MSTLEDLERVARGGPPAPLSPDDRTRIAAARGVVDEALGSGSAVYGVTTCPPAGATRDSAASMLGVQSR